MHEKRILTGGKNLDEANKALIMLHGRGGSAEDILSLASYLNVKDYALVAPQATNSTWYPLSFMAPPHQNEPWLSSALELLKSIVADIKKEGIEEEYIYLLGFSQGACLTLDFICRNATKYGGAVAFTGGLIGDKIYSENYEGDFNQTSVLIGSSDPDPHVPVERIHETSNILQSMNADLTVKIYKNMGHTINQDEIELANKLIFF